MGLFFNRKKNKPKEEEKASEVQDAERVYLDTPKMGPDMVSLIKDEQEELMNPFAEGEEKENNLNKSYAKMHGTKYAGIKGRQLASSKVVDVRSYVKPEEKPELKEKTAVEKDLEEIERQKEETKKSASSSFFDDILKSIEEDIDDDDAEEELPISEPEPEVKKEVKKSVKKETKKQTKRKKSIDIDIISGDFGGTDIL